MQKINLLPPRRKENIVVLSYSLDGNAIKLSPLDRAEDNLKIDFERGLWSHRSYENLEIGTNRPISLNDRHGVIGVYDKRDPDHAKAVAHAITEARRNINLDRSL